MGHFWRVFVDFPDHTQIKLGDQVALSTEDSHHLKNVLRLTKGTELLAICTKSHRQFKACITNPTQPLSVEILSEEYDAQDSGKISTLCFALCKGKKNDLVCEKACELGVEHIVLWQAQHSIMRLNSEKDIDSKLKRWQRIIESAANQCQRTRMPKVFFAANLEELLDILAKISKDQDKLLSCSLSEAAQSLNSMDCSKAALHLLIGPEGDLSPEEERALCQFGFELVSLGPYVLRSETAAIAAMAMAQGLWGFKQE